jgi:hypothetical protein
MLGERWESASQMFWRTGESAGAMRATIMQTVVGLRIEATTLYSYVVSYSTELLGL